jgi:hypothetical protein
MVGRVFPLLFLLVVGCRETTVSPAPSEVTSAALSRLPTKAADKIARSKVPVLVPANDDFLARGIVMVEPTFYAFASAVDGVNVSVQGTSFEHASAAVAPFERKDTLRGRPAIVTETDAIWTASWTENGFAYVVSVECARADDSRCHSKAFVRDVVERLVFVGGAP